jgi:DNA (cytosine-5)-methyltransferase 1
VNVGSLFSGIGGFDLGLERAGMRVAWQADADEFCRRVLARHWPDVPCYEDVRELRGSDVEPVDVLCGGFPCQDISAAGKGAGIDGEQSGLWSEFARLICELRPDYVIVENVSALLGRGLGRVLGDLAESGYDAEWDCIPASAIGAPHQRDRVWIVDYPSSVGGPHGTRLFEGASLGSVLAGANGRSHTRDSAARTRLVGSGSRLCEGHDAALADAEVIPIGTGLSKSEPEGIRRGRSGYSGGAGDVGNADEIVDGASGPRQVEAGAAGGLVDAGWWSVEPAVGRVADGVPARVDRLRSLGNALVPQIAEWLGRRIIEWEALAS